MESPESSTFEPDEGRPAGPLILGVPPTAAPGLVRTAAKLAAALELHLVCAFVDPASYLIEWESPGDLVAATLDPAVNEEALYPAEEVRRMIEAVLGPAGSDWSFRVLNGGVSNALARLGEASGASMIVVGAGRAGILSRISQTLEGSVATALTRIQNRPVVVIPEPAGPGRRRRTLKHRRASA